MQEALTCEEALVLGHLCQHCCIGVAQLEVGASGVISQHLGRRREVGWEVGAATGGNTGRSSHLSLCRKRERHGHWTEGRETGRAHALL
jgi:hypothetical protein